MPLKFRRPWEDSKESDTTKEVPETAIETEETEGAEEDASEV